MNIADFIRSILIGQTLWTFVWIALMFAMIRRLNLRPGFVLGLTILALGDLGAITYVLVATFQRLGQPPDYRTWLASAAIVLESLGCVLVAAHLFFHDEELLHSIKKWFHNE